MRRWTNHITCGEYNNKYTFMYSYMYIHTRILLLCCKDILQYCIVHFLDNRKVLIIKKVKSQILRRNMRYKASFKLYWKFRLIWDHLTIYCQHFLILKLARYSSPFFVYIPSVSIMENSNLCIISPSPLSECRFYVMKEKAFQVKLQLLLLKKYKWIIYTCLLLKITQFREGHNKFLGERS